MERLKRRFPMLEPAFLADVLTTRQEGESRPYRRIEIEMQGYVCVCPCCQSEVLSELLEVIGDPKPLPLLRAANIEVLPRTFSKD